MPSSAAEEGESWSRLGRADSESARASSEVTPAGTGAAFAPTPRRPPRPEASNPGGPGVSPGKQRVGGRFSGRLGVLVRAGRGGTGGAAGAAGRGAPAGGAAAVAGVQILGDVVGHHRPGGEGAGAVVVVEPGAVVVVDDGRVLVVDRPDPPEDGRDVLVVESPGAVEVVDVELDVVVAPSSSSAGAVVVVEGSVGVVVVVVVESDDGTVVGVVSTVVDVVAVPSPGSRSARAELAGKQAATTIIVVRAIARRTRRSMTRVSWVRGERQRCRPHRAWATFVTDTNVPKR